jgi:hypothetical protein
LFLEITGIEPGEAGHADAVTFAGKAVADKTGIRGPAIAAAQRNDLAACGKGVARIIARRRAGGRGKEEGGERQAHTEQTPARLSGSGGGTFWHATSLFLQ